MPGQRRVSADVTGGSRLRHSCPVPYVDANGLRFYVETLGSPSDPAMLMVNGFGSQINGFDPTLAEMLARRGRFVVRYDNRDVGLSTRLDGHPIPLAALQEARRNGTETPEVAYTFSDMAADGMTILSALGIERAHVVGSSMGGMIAQTMAIEHPGRLLSLTSIMSTTGEPHVGQSTTEANAALMSAPATTREDYIIQGVRNRAVNASKRHYDPEFEAFRLARDWDRGIYPEGTARQLCALLASGSRAEGLAALDVSTLVIHGRDDILIEPSGGMRTAELVAGSVFALLSDMGHDYPRPIWPTLVDLLITHQDRAGHAVHE